MRSLDYCRSSKVVGGGKKRIAYLDALKCLGIILVIEGHVRMFGMGLSDTYDNPSSLLLYSFNMPIFFFVSGLLAFKDAELGQIKSMLKLKEKLLYLVLPAVAFVAYFQIYNQQSIFDFCTQGFGRYWFTFTLFEIFVLYYIGVTFAHCKLVILFFVCIISCLGIGYLSFLGEYDIALLDFNHLAKYFPYFAFGVVARMYPLFYHRIMKSELVKFFATVVYFFLLVYLFYGFFPYVVHRFLRDIVLRMLGMLVVVSWFYNNNTSFEKDSKINRCISLIGKNSLAIYFLQYFFLPNLKSFNEIVSNLDIFSTHVLAILYTIVVTIVCLLFIKLLSNSVIIKKYCLGNK